jgi:hypothetical protein
LLPLKNDNWLDEDEAELTADRFEDRMTLESITVRADGSFDFWHKDGDSPGPHPGFARHVVVAAARAAVAAELHRRV